MKSKKEIYFGDKNTFAIRYVPRYSDKTKKYYYAYCHLVLDGQIIGDKDEPCYLNSWLASFERLKEQIKNDLISICHPEFNNRSDRELFELIWKANQLENEYKLDYLHLPILENKVWRNCHISIDETTDAFLITMSEIDGKIKFLWEGWRAPCPADKINRLFSTIADPQFIVETMENCLQTIKNECLNYPIRQ